MAASSCRGFVRRSNTCYASAAPAEHASLPTPHGYGPSVTAIGLPVRRMMGELVKYQPCGRLKFTKDWSSIWFTSLSPQARHRSLIADQAACQIPQRRRHGTLVLRPRAKERGLLDGSTLRTEKRYPQGRCLPRLAPSSGNATFVRYRNSAPSLSQKSPPRTNTLTSNSKVNGTWATSSYSPPASRPNA